MQRCAPACKGSVCGALLPRAASCARAVVLANGRCGALAAPPRVPAWQRSNFVELVIPLAPPHRRSLVRNSKGLRAMAIARDMTEDEVSYPSASVLHRRPRATELTPQAVGLFLPPSSLSLQYNNIANELLDDILEKLEVYSVHSHAVRLRDKL